MLTILQEELTAMEEQMVKIAELKKELQGQETAEKLLQQQKEVYVYSLQCMHNCIMSLRYCSRQDYETSLQELKFTLAKKNSKVSVVLSCDCHAIHFVL